MSGKIFIRVYIVVFVIALIGVGIWGWQVVQRVRVTAHRTDAQMRTLAWASLSYAAAHGVFPMNADDLKAFGAGPDSLTIAPANPAAGWPTSRADALHGESPADLTESLRAVVVTFGTDPGMPPFLKPDGLPTMVGTNDEVNGWLDAFGKRGKAAATAPATPAAPTATPGS